MFHSYLLIGRRSQATSLWARPSCCVRTGSLSILPPILALCDMQMIPHNALHQELIINHAIHNKAVVGRKLASNQMKIRFMQWFALILLVCTYLDD